jgi:cold shock CspA family protein
MGLLVGFSGAVIYSEFTWAARLRSQLAEQQRSSLEWERMNRQERQAIADMKTISVEEMRSWVATLDEQNKTFANLQSKYHEQEIELAGPASTYILIAAVITLSGVAIIVFWLRDANAAAATTLENAVALAPDEMLRSLAFSSHFNRQPKTVIVEHSPAVPALPALPARYLEDDGNVTGEVVQFFEDRGFGFILPDKGPEKLWFHIRDVMTPDRTSIAVGVRVRFRRSTGKKGPAAVFVRRDGLST